MTAQLIVPSEYAKGKPHRRKVENPFAKMLRSRKSPDQRRYHGKVWKDTGYEPIGEAPGRRMGKPHGSYIDDLAQLRKAIVLCSGCVSRFYYKRAKYYRDEVFGRCTGKCDACKNHSVHARLFIPEESLADPGGMLRPGQVWTPR